MIEQVNCNQVALVERLRRLGIPAGDTDVYLMLLAHGPHSRQQLLIRSRLPPENVRNALERLQRLQLAIGIKRDKRTRYQATYPINTGLRCCWMTVGAMQPKPLPQLAQTL